MPRRHRQAPAYQFTHHGLHGDPHTECVLVQKTAKIVTMTVWHILPFRVLPFMTFTENKVADAHVATDQNQSLWRGEDGGIQLEHSVVKINCI